MSTIKVHEGYSPVHISLQFFEMTEDAKITGPLKNMAVPITEEPLTAQNCESRALAWAEQEMSSENAPQGLSAELNVYVNGNLKLTKNFKPAG